ncbi:MAG: hypothetical protein ACREBQ_08475, partial [Nitrososphaerales archaeon]
LLSVYVLACVLVLFELFRIGISQFVSNSLLMTFYTVGSTSLVLANAWLLAVAAVGTYLRPKSPKFRDIFSEIYKHVSHALLFTAFSAAVIFSGISLVVFEPYNIRAINNLWGISVLSTNFQYTYLVTLLTVLVFFLIYPTPMLILAARKVANRAIKRGLIILAACWAAIALDFLVFDGYVWSAGIDANDVMYLVFASIFSVTAVIFRNASTLAGFFEARQESTKVPESHPFSGRIGMPTTFLAGRNFLLEIDPSTTYEETVKEFAMENISTKSIVFAFTTKGSPVYRALSDGTDVKFYMMSTDVSYPKPTGKPNEVLVPQNDVAVILHLINQTMGSTEGSGVALVFDNVSDLIMSSGFENSYKFLKQANQVLSEPRVTSIFLITKNAHDEREVLLVKSLFANHLSVDSTGLHVTRK